MAQHAASGALTMHPVPVKVLVVEDEPGLRDFLERGLLSEGYAVLTASDGPTGLALASDPKVDVVVLDLMLPGMSGDEVLVRLRCERPGVPVIVLTARDGVDDRVRNLDAGADDYMVKPFSLAELTARLRARLRSVEQPSSTVIEVGSVRLHLATRRASVADTEISLTNREFGLAETLMRHGGQVLSQQQLLDRVWGYQFEPATSNVVEVCVRSLRRKLGASVIETVRGAGYRFTG
jgi:DNA-binding response OmpR family regulator